MTHINFSSLGVVFYMPHRNTRWPEVTFFFSYNSSHVDRAFLNGRYSQHLPCNKLLRTSTHDCDTIAPRGKHSADNTLLSHLTMAEMPPPTPRRMQRIASQLGKLSLELVEPIISTLPLHKALDLMMAPLGPDAAPGLLITHRQLSPLVQAFISSPAWKHIFRDTELATQILLVWEGLNRIFKLCHGNGYSKIIKETNPAFFPWAKVQSTWKILGHGADQISDGDWLLAKLEDALWVMAVPGEQTAIFSNRPSNAAFMILPPEYGALPNSPTIDALPPQGKFPFTQVQLFVLRSTHTSSSQTKFSQTNPAFHYSTCS